MKKTNLPKKLIKAIIYAIIVLAISGISVTTGIIEQIGDITSMVHISISNILRVIIMVFFVLAISNLLQLLLESVKKESKRILTLSTILASLTQYAAAIICVCWGFTIMGVNVSTIFASVGILALIVGFGAESLIEDVIIGIFMVFENQYNVGDIIEIGSFRGTVKKIGIRTTVIADAGNNEKIINNSEMKNILNRSNNMSKSICDIGISYDTDIKKMEEKLPEMLNRIFENNKGIFLLCPEYLGIQELGDSAIQLRFSADVEEANIYKGTRYLNRELLLAFQEASIGIPYPQIQIHTK